MPSTIRRIVCTESLAFLASVSGVHPIWSRQMRQVHLSIWSRLPREHSFGKLLWRLQIILKGLARLSTRQSSGWPWYLPPLLAAVLQCSTANRALKLRKVAKCGEMLHTVASQELPTYPAIRVISPPSSVVLMMFDLAFLIQDHIMP